MAAAPEAPHTDLPPNPPPLSLKINNAPLTMVLADLNKSLGPGVVVGEFSTGAPPLPFTIDLQDEPFWAIFDALQKQHPIDIDASPVGISMAVSERGVHRFAVDGNAIAYVGDVSLRSVIHLQNKGAGAPPTPLLEMNLTLVVDPRIRAAGYRDFKVSKAVDDAGHSFVQVGEQKTPALQASAGNMFICPVTLVPAAGGQFGKTISLTCDAAYAAPVNEIHKQLDLQQSGGEVLVGGRLVHVDWFDAGVACEIQIVTVIQPQAAGEALAQPGPIAYAVVDSGDRTIWTGAGDAPINVEISPRSSKAPYHMEIRATDKTVDVPVHFELKDVPLP
jgi:hypothetical protein